jgi:hypothetical protein
MLVKKKLQLMKDMWCNLFSMRGDQIKEAEQNFKCAVNIT